MIGQALRNILLAALALVIVLPAVSAASINWNAPASIVADTDVSTNGSLLYAYDDSGTGSTVNTVPFAAGNSSSAFGGNVTMSGFTASTTNSFGGGANVPWSNLSTNYQTMLQGGVMPTMLPPRPSR